MKKSIDLSIVIPVHNEEKRVDHLLEVYDYLESQKFSWELVVVNDGSKDKTLKILRQMKKKFPMEIVSYEINKGKGYAVKQGMLSAKGAYRLFMDVDLSTPLKEISVFWKQRRSAEVIIGTRKKQGAEVLVKQSWLREHLGKGFTFLSQVILGVNVSDFTCGFKWFSAEATEKIFSRMTIERWGFDAEILFLAKKLGYAIKEIPVQWTNDARTKVKFPEDIFRSFNDLKQIIVNDRWRRIYE